MECRADSLLHCRSGKPALGFSYEDLKSSTLVQLMLVAHFVGLDFDTTIRERALCTVLAESQMTHRNSTQDSPLAALSLLGKERVLTDIKKINHKFISSKMHFLDLKQMEKL